MATNNRPISKQSGIRQYNGNLTNYTGALGGLTPDIHTLRSLSPLTNNRTIVVMYRGPYFLMKYFGGSNAYAANSEFATYKKIVEYYYTGIRCDVGDQSLGHTELKAGFAGRTISFPTQQNAQASQSLTITVPELDGRPITNFHNMWVDGIADPINGLTTYHGNVSGSTSEAEIEQRIFASATGVNEEALEPSPAWEVAEFLIIPVDRSGARAEGALLALGCVPRGRIGYDIFNQNNQGNSQIVTVDLSFNCQFVESAFVNDIASRYLKQFATFGNSLNFNPGVGDAFFKSSTSESIDSDMFNGGKRPALDAIQSGVGNAPVFRATQNPINRKAKEASDIQVGDHMQIYNSPTETTDIGNPYAGR